MATKKAKGGHTLALLGESKEKDTNRMRRTTIYVESETLERVSELCRKKKISVSSLVEALLKDLLAEEKEKPSSS